MSGNLQVVIGPARCGKAAYLCERYAHELAQWQAAGRLASGCGLWIAPNRFAVARAERLLLTRLPSGCLAPQVLTFEAFSDRVLQFAPAPVRSITRLQKRRLLRHILQQRSANGELPYLKPLAGAGGLIDTLSAQIAELKRLEIWPDEFRAALGHSQVRPKDADLACIYEEYQELLTQHHLYDAEGRFWSARALLKEGNRGAIQSLELAVVDGFTDFTRPQLEMLETIVDAAREVYISLPMDLTQDRRTGFQPVQDGRRTGFQPVQDGRITGVPPDEWNTAFQPVPGGLETRPTLTAPQRSDLFSKSWATLQQLRDRFPRLRVERLSERRDDGCSIASTFAKVFSPPPPSETRPLTGEGKVPERSVVSGGPGSIRRQSIDVWRTTSSLQEIRAIARDTKVRLRAGEVRADDVVVVYRCLDDATVALVEETFAEYGVDVEIDSARPLSTAPFVRNLLLLLRLDHGDWPYEDVMAVIRNWGIRWPDLGICPPDAARDVRVAAERLVRQAQIPSGRAALFAHVNRAAQEGPAAALQAESVTDQSASGKAAPVFAAFSALAHILDELPRQATPVEWADVVVRLFPLCGAQATDTNACPGANRWERIDEQARIHIVDVLRELHRLEQQVHGRPWQRSRTDVLELLQDLAAHECFVRSQSTAGRVQVLSAIAARGVEAAYLYFAGLSEHAMPLGTSGEAYYSERETARLIGAGLPFVSPSRRYEEEMFLFYEVASRARERLVLSYPALDEKAQPMLPSPFVLEVERAGGENVQEVALLELRPVDRDAGPQCLRELRTRAVCDAVIDGRGMDRLLGLIGTAGGRDETAASVLDGLQIICERSHRDAFGPAEGLLASDEAMRVLAAEFGPLHPWSATALERFALCPFRFFLERVLGIEPMDELELATDHRRRGSLAHQCLVELYQALGELDRSRAVSAQVDADAFRRVIFAFVERLKGRLEGGGYPQALEALDLEQVVGLAETFYEQQKCYEKWGGALDRPLLPTHFEVRFGPPTRDAPPCDEDPLCTDTPFELDLGDERILLTGRVDRIDVGYVGQTPVFNIVDYKTGGAKPPRVEDIRLGLHLQIPLYAMAVEELLMAGDGALAWQADYWWLREAGFGNKGKNARGGPFTLRELRDGELVESDQWKALRAEIAQRLRQMIRSVRDGQFVVFSQDNQCTRKCPYDGVCRVGQIRALEKVWPGSSTSIHPS